MAWANTPGTDAVYRTREYKQAKQAATHAYRQGDLCWHCHQPMHTDRPSSLHLEHRGSPLTGDFTALGLTHPHCNVTDGARRGRARQNTTRLTW